MKSIFVSLLLAKTTFLLLGTATAFSPDNHHLTTNSRPRLLTNQRPTGAPLPRRSLRSTTTSRYLGEESEWYSPPPEPKQTEEEGPKLPRGVTPKVTTIRSKIELEEFLAEDDRLCVVKFHAAW